MGKQGDCRITVAPITRLMVTLSLAAAILLGAGCQQSDTSTPRQSGQEDLSGEPAKTTASEDSEITPPAWVQRSRSWPDTMVFVIDSTLEIVRDGLMIRLKTEVSQDVSGLRFQDERPLLADVLMTVRPVPKWELAKGLKIDSLVLHDPVKNRDLRTFQMLSFQRAYEGGTVRTQFLPNTAEAFRQSPDLEEGQLLEPTLYLTWDHRHIVASVPAVRLSFLRNP